MVMQAISSGRTPPLLGEGAVLNLLTFDPITRIKFKNWERPHSQTSVDFYRSSE